jgi:hypothetical protein
MKRFYGCLKGILIVGTGLVCSSLAYADDQDALAFSASAQHLFDSNFLRSPDEIEEQITRFGAGIRFNKRISAQLISLAVSGNQYRYAEQTQLDASALEGEASWQSRFTSNVSSRLEFKREETPVDKLEFIGKDLVAKETTNAQLSLGDSKRVGVIVGFHQMDITHSNQERSNLDLEDRDYFSELRYRFASTSWIGLRYREGERRYVITNLALGGLDFDYRQLELETAWVMSPKTKLTGQVGYFDRKAVSGEDNINDGDGNLASLTLDWAITEKLNSQLTYRFSQPAIGETSDAPSEVSDSQLIFQWLIKPKVKIGFGGSYAELLYEDSAVIVGRTERNITFSPLLIDWAYSDAMSVRFNSQWMDRRSPLFERDYQGYSAGVALAFRF